MNIVYVEEGMATSERVNSRSTINMCRHHDGTHCGKSFFLVFSLATLP